MRITSDEFEKYNDIVVNEFMDVTPHKIDENTVEWYAKHTKIAILNRKSDGKLVFTKLKKGKFC